MLFLNFIEISLYTGHICRADSIRNVTLRTCTERLRDIRFERSIIHLASDYSSRYLTRPIVSLRTSNDELLRRA